MNILVSGATGMLGRVIVKDCLSNSFNVSTIGRSNPEIPEVDHINYDFSNSSFSQIKSKKTFDFIIHCAANTDHSDCDKNIINCYEINAFSVLALRKLFPNVFFILISSDAVFNDNCENRTFDGPTRALSNYGVSKEIAEKLTLLFNKSLVIRTTIVGFSDQKKSLCDWIVNSLEGRKNIKLFDDVLFNPISIYELSKAIIFIINNSHDYTSKIIHINNQEVISKYEFGIRLAELLELDSKYIEKGSLHAFENKGNRNFNQQLTIELNDLEKILKYKPTLERTIKTIRKHYEIN